MGHTIELSNRSQTTSKARRDRDTKNCVHVRDPDEISDTMNGGSVHGSEKDLVSNKNGIMVKHEYEVRVEDKVSQDLPIMGPRHAY